VKRHLLQGAGHEAGPGVLGIWSYTAGRVGEGGSLLYLGIIDQDNMKLIALCHTDLSVNNECEARSVVNIPTESADLLVCGFRSQARIGGNFGMSLGCHWEKVDTVFECNLTA
jgi:hypothetical protein